jgi:hypothetical protein
VHLQALLDKRASTIIMTQKCHRFYSGRYFKRIRYHFKIGWRWSTGQSEYKERSWKDASDNNIFIISAVPFQLCSTKSFADKFILWHIPRPSMSYSRPTRIQFKKETAELAKEITVLEERIKKLENQGKKVSYL